MEETKQCRAGRHKRGARGNSLFMPNLCSFLNAKKTEEKTFESSARHVKIAMGNLQ